MSEELLKGLADEFGRSITSAPSTPHFIIHPDGSFSELSTGIHSAEEIVTQIQEAQGLEILARPQQETEWERRHPCRPPPRNC